MYLRTSLAAKKSVNAGTYITYNTALYVMCVHLWVMVDGFVCNVFRETVKLFMPYEACSQHLSHSN